MERLILTWLTLLGEKATIKRIHDVFDVKLAKRGSRIEDPIEINAIGLDINKRLVVEFKLSKDQETTMFMNRPIWINYTIQREYLSSSKFRFYRKHKIECWTVGLDDKTTY